MTMPKRGSMILMFCALLATIGATPAVALDKVASPMTASPVLIQNKKALSSLNEVELLRSQNARLKALVKDLSRRLEELRLDKPFCKDMAMSANKAGATRDCSPYACDFVPGTCLNRCGTTDDCAPGAVCDTSNGMCVYVR